MTKLADLMRVDPLADAEKLTGESYKTDSATSALGFLLHLDHNKQVEAAAKAERDTYYNLDLAGALEVYTDLGFEVVLTDGFRHEDRDEQFIVLWHPDGILGTLESYMGTRMNSAKIYYNVESSESLPWAAISSGHYAIHDEARKVWSGDHDGRTGLRASINGLREHGKFLAQWIDQPRLWPVTHAESRTLDQLDWQAKSKGYQDFINARLERLPEHVRVAITPA